MDGTHWHSSACRIGLSLLPPCTFWALLEGSLSRQNASVTAQGWRVKFTFKMGINIVDGPAGLFVTFSEFGCNLIG